MSVEETLRQLYHISADNISSYGLEDIERFSIALNEPFAFTYFEYRRYEIIFESEQYALDTFKNQV